MSKLSKKTISDKNRKVNYSIQSIIPLILIIFLVPLIVRLKILSVPEAARMLVNGQETTGDFFAYYKMVLFLTFSAIGVSVFLYKYFIATNITIKKTKLYYFMAIFSVLAIFSTIFATHKDVALKGIFDRYEGLYLLLGYMVVLFLTINLIDNEKQVKYLLTFLGASAIIMSLIGITQLLGKDIFASSLGKELIVPSKYMVEELKFSFGNVIYGTLYNPNYVGLYMSTIFALSSTILLLAKSNYSRIFSATVMILSFINLLGSGSRTGMIGIVFYILLLIIFFRSTLFRLWKPIIILILSVFAILYGINFYSEGYIENRLISIKDSFEKTEVSNLHDIILEDKQARILADDYEIKIIYDEDEFTFKDKDENFIEAVNTDGKINFKDQPYNNHYIIRKVYEDNIVLEAHISTNKGEKTINLAIDPEGEFHVLGTSGQLIDLIKYPSWGFVGRESFASNRGYIWSRTIPLLKDTLFIGYGPDTYALHFPNDDYVGKVQSNFDLNTLVDKPHNLYLQTAVNTGVLSLISLLAIFTMYIVSGVKVYFKKKQFDNLLEVSGIGIFFAICVYLMMSFLNDSTVSVAPVFWILLGIGISINMNLSKQENKDNQ